MNATEVSDIISSGRKGYRNKNQQRKLTLGKMTVMWGLMSSNVGLIY